KQIKSHEPAEMKALLRGWESSKMRPLTLPVSFESSRIHKNKNFYAEINQKYWKKGEKAFSFNKISKKFVLWKEKIEYLNLHEKNLKNMHLKENVIFYNKDSRFAAPKKYLVRVFGSTPYTSKAVERPLRASCLNSSAVFILFSSVPIVWCGGKNTGDVRQTSRRLAPRNAPLITEGKESDDFWTELGGLEPATFIGLFDNWNHNLLRDYKPFEIFCTLLKDRNQSVRMQTISKAITDFDNYIKYPPTMLKSEPDNLPAGVDVRRKEMHLTYDNFIAIFKMEPAEFEKLSTWKRQRLKQAAGLF
ncbi:QUAI protein, partial [Acromyrmex heyeri]